MTNIVRSIASFMHLGGQDIATLAEIATADQIDLRNMLIQEEWNEVNEAIQEGDVAGTADGYADLAVVAIGGLIETVGDTGAEHVLNAVLRANLAKVQDSPGRDESGKIVKPAGWSHPDIDGIVREINDNDPIFSRLYFDGEYSGKMVVFSDGDAVYRLDRNHETEHAEYLHASDGRISHQIDTIQLEAMMGLGGNDLDPYLVILLDMAGDATQLEKDRESNQFASPNVLHSSDFGNGLWFTLEANGDDFDVVLGAESEEVSRRTGTPRETIDTLYLYGVVSAISGLTDETDAFTEALELIAA